MEAVLFFAARPMTYTDSGRPATRGTAVAPTI